MPALVSPCSDLLYRSYYSSAYLYLVPRRANSTIGREFLCTYSLASRLRFSSYAADCVNGRRFNFLSAISFFAFCKQTGISARKNGVTGKINDKELPYQFPVVQLMIVSR